MEHTNAATNPAGDSDASATPAVPVARQQAKAILASGKPRETIREELASLREKELLRCVSLAALMDASTFWREVALRRFLLQRETGDGC